MDPKIIKKTQESLGKIIKKPPLTEKLLTKPPFRFLHDIMTSVIKTTGFMKGLFNENELNSENVKDRDSKVSFLQKSVDIVSLATGRQLSVKPMKIVAGHEPEKTNELLQAIAAAINSKVDNDDCVRKVLNKDNKGEEKTEKTEKSEKSRDRERSDDRRKRDEEKDKKNRDRDKGRDGERSRDREERNGEQNRDREKGRGRERSRDRDEKEKKEDRHREKDDRHRDKEREGRHKSGRSRHSDSGEDVDDENFENYDEVDNIHTPSINSDDLLGSDDDFDTPYNTPDGPLNATYSIRGDDAIETQTGIIPRQVSTTGLTMKGRRGPTDEEIAEIESLRRKQGSRNRSNRPKAARPRREPMKQLRADQLASFVSESETSSDKEEISVDGKKRKSGTKSRLSLRPKADVEDSPVKAQQEGQVKTRRDSLKGPKTSTPKNSPASPRNTVRGNKTLDTSRTKTDTRSRRDKKQLEPPAKITPGSQKMSTNEKGGSHSAGKALDKRDTSNGDHGKSRSTSLDSKKSRTKNKRDSLRDGDESPKKGRLETPKKEKANTSESHKEDRSKRRMSRENMLKDESKDSDPLKKKSSNDAHLNDTPKRRRGLMRDSEEENRQESRRKSRTNDESSDKGAYYKRKTTTDTGDKRRRSNFDMLTANEQDYQRREEEAKENEAPTTENAMVNGDHKPDHPPRLQRPSSAKGSRRRMEEAAQPPGRNDPAIGEDDLPPQVQQARSLARPSSARPAPPKRKEDVISNEPAMRLGSGKPQNLIIDDGRDSDEDETFVVEESAPAPVEPEQNALKMDIDDDEDDHGGLVKKIMETKKEYDEPRRTAIERPNISDAQRRKQREAVQKEIDKLRGSIQTLTRSANPLGKIMDYVQEDLDSMQKELEKWKLENKEHSLELKREKAVTERSVEPLKVQLTEVDQSIKDQLDLIGAVKSNIIRNDQKIDKMLRTIAKS